MTQIIVNIAVTQVWQLHCKTQFARKIVAKMSAFIKPRFPEWSKSKKKKEKIIATSSFVGVDPLE